MKSKSITHSCTVQETIDVTPWAHLCVVCSPCSGLNPASFPLRRCWEGGQWGLWPFTGGCCWLVSPSLPPPQKYPFLYDKQRLHLQQESPQSSLSFHHLRNRFNYPVQSPTSRGVYTLVYFFFNYRSYFILQPSLETADPGNFHCDWFHPAKLVNSQAQHLNWGRGGLRRFLVPDLFHHCVSEMTFQ